MPLVWLASTACYLRDVFVAGKQIRHKSELNATLTCAFRSVLHMETCGSTDIIHLPIRADK